MRWFVFILIMIPSLAAADKATRDNLLKQVEVMNQCWPVFVFVMPMTKKLDKYEEMADETQKFKLTLQYEHDEILFSSKNLDKFGRRIEKIFKENLTEIGEKMQSLTQSEQDYLEMKILDLLTVQAEKQLSSKYGEINSFVKQLKVCIKRYNLND